MTTERNEINELISVKYKIDNGYTEFTLSSYDKNSKLGHWQIDRIINYYQNNIPNTLVALEMAHRIGASPLMVMQNLHIIQGRPSWSSAFIIAALNASGRFTALKYKATATACQAYATEKATGELLEGPTVTLDMAKAEGWVTKQGSKWQTMPELMLRYRAAAFFGRLYAPEIMMGMHAVEEIQDVTEHLAPFAPVLHVGAVFACLMYVYSSVPNFLLLHQIKLHVPVSVAVTTKRAALP